MLNIITNVSVLPLFMKPKLIRHPLIISGYTNNQKDLALAFCIQSLLTKNVIKRVEKVRSLGFYSLSKAKASTEMEAVHRTKQAKPFSNSRKVQTETPEFIRAFLVPSEGDLNRLLRHLSSNPHPPGFKEMPLVHPQVSNLPAHCPSG